MHGCAPGSCATFLQTGTLSNEMLGRTPALRMHTFHGAIVATPYTDDAEVPQRGARLTTVRLASDSTAMCFLTETKTHHAICPPRSVKRRGRHRAGRHHRRGRRRGRALQLLDERAQTGLRQSLCPCLLNERDGTVIPTIDEDYDLCFPRRQAMPVRPQRLRSSAPTVPLYLLCLSTRVCG